MIDVVTRAVTTVADGIKLIEVAAADGASLPGFSAGDHIDVVATPEITRSYSLVDASDPDPKVYRFAVALAADSRGGSRALHDFVSGGKLLQVSAPMSSFVLDEATTGTSLFVAGGIGITPVLSMIRQLTALGRRWVVHYAIHARSGGAFIDELEELRNEGFGSLHLYVSEEDGARSLSTAAIVAAAQVDSELYCCGPNSLIDSFLGAGASLPSEVLHVERFSNDLAPAAGGFTVELKRSRLELTIGGDDTILDAVLDAGIDVNFSCTEGICGSCRVGVLAGEPDHRDSYLSEGEKSAGDTMMICCSGSKGERLVLDI